MTIIDDFEAIRRRLPASKDPDYCPETEDHEHRTDCAGRCYKCGGDASKVYYS